MGYDEVIVHLGDFGKYQRLVFVLLCLTALSCAFHKMSRAFVFAKPNFRCQLPFEDGEHDTANSDHLSGPIEFALPRHVWLMSFPATATPKDGRYQACSHFDIDFSMINIGRNSSLENSTIALLLARLPTIKANGTRPCTRYVYDRSQYHNSAVTEWNMVCDRSFMSAVSDATFMLGVLVGSIGFGQLSDKCGRKPVFFIALVTQVTFGVLAGIAPEYLTYTAARFVVGATTSGVFLVAYVIAMEMVGPAKRLFAGIFLMMFFSLGFMLTAAFAYFIRDWRSLQIALSLPGVLFLGYYWIIPESARWLISKNRKDSAVENIKKAARFNKVNLDTETINRLLDEEINKNDENDYDRDHEHEREREPTLAQSPAATASVFDLLRYPNLRRKTLLIFFDWFVNSGTYYGLSWNTNSLGDNVLCNFVISGAVEIPAYTFLLFTLNRWGRRTILCGCMLVAGSALLLTVVVPNDADWIIIVLAMIGKLAITASYGTVYIFSAEQFPTVVRNVGLGASSMVARMGGILAPFLNMLADVWRPLPLIIFGCAAFIGGLLSLLLPETHNAPTLETIADGENFGKKRHVNAFARNGIENGRELKVLDIMESTPLNGDIANGQNGHATENS